MKIERRLRLVPRLVPPRSELIRKFGLASEFLTRCQLVDKGYGLLSGTVSPWELGHPNFPPREDFHDTLQAIWVWTYHFLLTGGSRFEDNIQKAWSYVDRNCKRFMPGNSQWELYDCSYYLMGQQISENVAPDAARRVLAQKCARRLAVHLKKLKAFDAREYLDPFWMAYALGRYGSHLDNKFGKYATDFVERALSGGHFLTPFHSEPSHSGRGEHDFFSSNATRIMALTLYPSGAVKKLLLQQLPPLLPRGFTRRLHDENAWNATVANALGRAYRLTHDEAVLDVRNCILTELDKRMSPESHALARSSDFEVAESWATFFYLHAVTID